LAVSAKYIAIAVPLLLVVFYFLQKYYLRTSRQLRFLDLESKSSLYTQFEESLAGLVTLRAYGWQVPYAIRNFRYLDTTQKPYYLLLAIQRWLNFTIDMIIAIMAIVLIVLAMQAKSLVSPGYTGVALLNIMSFNQTMKFLVTSWTQLETSIGSISRVKAFAAATEREDAGDESREPPADWPTRGEIEIRNFSASYTYVFLCYYSFS
jgi:ABC-type multidrug transport system fused ATPase/permease subunit